MTLAGRHVNCTGRFRSDAGAVELEGLRNALKRAGFTRAQTPTPVTPRQEKTERVAPRQRVTVRASVEQTIRRVMRQVRALRVERLAPAFRQWLGVQPHVRETTSEQLNIQPDAPRQSRGIRM